VIGGRVKRRHPVCVIAPAVNDDPRDLRD